MDQWKFAAELLESVAVTATLAFFFGAIRRRAETWASADTVLGLFFGAAAAFSMLDPVTVSPGVIVDVRLVPMALAGAFLGPRGMMSALAVAAAVRIGIGGVGAASGVAGLAISGAAGVLWGLWQAQKPQQRQGLVPLCLLGLATSVGLVGLFLLPAATALDVLGRFGPVLVPVNLIGVVLVAMVLQRENRLIAKELELLADGTTDPLTGALNRRGFEARMAALNRRPRSSRGGAVLIVDIDHFKAVNDGFGHDAGDSVLVAVARHLESTLRPGDLMARIGGEEFAVYLHDVTAPVATGLAEAMRLTIAADRPANGPAITASIGIHWTDRAVKFAPALIAADTALYGAKNAGRNQVLMGA